MGESAGIRVSNPINHPGGRSFDTVTVREGEFTDLISRWAKKCDALQKENARLLKVIDLMLSHDSRESRISCYEMALSGINENGTVCDCCECAPCICEGYDGQAIP